LLFITANRIGDAVLSSGVLAAMMAEAPDQPVVVACGPVVAPLFDDLPGLERIHRLIRRGRIGHWLDLWRAMRGRRWRMVADLRGSLIGWTLRADATWSFRPSKRCEHRVEELARQLHLAAPLSPRLWIGEHRRAAAKDFAAGAPVLAIGPTANWGAKQWPADRFAEAALALTAADGVLPGAKIAVFGAASERAMAKAVFDAIPPERLIDAMAIDHLLDAAARLEKCSFYLGNDSGLMHLAAAAGVPTLGLFGPSPEWRYRPWGERTAVVRTPQSYQDLVGAPDFDHRRQASLMTGLSVEAVVGAAKELWRKVA
jgi:ADP-heptose:LPS heptosyltransferase